MNDTKPICAVENLCSVTQFPDLEVIATEEGAPVSRLANGRLERGDHWTGITANLEQQLIVQPRAGTTPQIRSISYLALAVHNLTQLSVDIAFEPFGAGSTYETIVDTITLPTLSTPAPADGPVGALAPDGRWIMLFDVAAGVYFRIRIPAAADFIPRISGLWVGTHWELSRGIALPFSASTREILGEELRNQYGWAGRGPGGGGRVSTWRVRLGSDLEYDLAAYHHEHHYGRSRPMWVIPRKARGDQAILTQIPTGSTFGYTRHQDSSYLQADVPIREHLPRRIA